MAEAGGHHGYPQQVYLVPATPVVAYAAPVAYSPTPLAYAPAHAGHFHKNRTYLYPVTGYAATPTTYAYGAAPAAYGMVAYTPSQGSAPPASGSAPPTVGAAPGVDVYQLRYVKVSGNGGGGGAGLSPAADGSIPTLPDLNADQNAKLRQLLKDHLATLSGTSLSPDKKQDSMVDWATGTYADLLGTSASSLSATQVDNARKVALALLGSTDSGSGSSGSGSVSSGSGNANGGSTGNAPPATYLLPAYQLYLPVAAPAHSGRLFHKY